MCDAKRRGGPSPQRKSPFLVIDNADLHDQLQRAAIVHEELELQMMELQERYTEVVCSLRDAEEELGTYRQKQSAYRSRFWFRCICV
ncbi:unnamed protein product [Gongylonema pulchrum]|uniref:GTD-binding domain-containing protein n=1 Tax=Gongylonema pulchrum TaxID=637853 RepID=A0A183E2R6_9BILA|nr:unnamed protein product [Gongylonema pulchrum]